MVTLQIDPLKIKDLMPGITEDFIDELRNSKSLSRNTKPEKMSWIVSFGFFNKKIKTETDALERTTLLEEYVKLRYEERLKVEIKKIRVCLSLKAGNYMRTDRCSNVPDFVIKMVEEIVKYTMFREQEMLKDPNVMDSLKDFKNIFSEKSAAAIQEKEISLDVDTILDKINSDGMNSLSKRELDYLEKMSKRM